MKAIGLDTSGVLRLLTGVPENQARLALDQLGALAGERKKPLISVEKLVDLLESGVVFPESNGAALRTLKSEEKTKAGFPDRLTRSQYLQIAEEVLTFDVDFGKMDKVRRLKA